MLKFDFTNLSIIIFLNIICNFTFIINKTVYSLLLTALIIILISIILLLKGFEYLALSFIITYAGGIAIMFLFLILVIDVKPELKKDLWSTRFKFITITLVTTTMSIFWLKIILTIYNKMNYDVLFHLITKEFTNEKIFKMELFQKANFEDLDAIGKYMFYQDSIYIYAISIFLFIATIVSIYLCQKPKW